MTRDEHLDTVTVVAACQAISRETTVAGLAATVVRVALEDSGALAGCLLLAERGELQVVARGTMNDHQAEVKVHPHRPPPEEMPLSIIDFVRSSRRKVILDDAGAHTMSREAHPFAKGGGSVACIPIVREDAVLGVLYLENAQVEGAFDTDRVLLLEVIATQTAIALENIQATERFKGLLESAPDAMVIADDAGTMVIVNVQAERLFGYIRDELIGKSMQILMPERYREAHMGYLCRYKEAPRFRPMGEGLQLYGLRKDGSEFPVDISLSPFTIDSTLLITAAIRDVTERKKAEEALRYSEARYRTLFQDNPTMIFTVDEEITILSVNPFALRQLGYAQEEMEGKNLISFFHEEDRPKVAEQLKLCLADPSKSHTWQFRKMCKGGEILWVEELGQAVYDLNGTLNVLVVCLDVTERLAAERALKESELKYRQLCENLEARVKEAVKEMRQKDKILIIQSRQAVMGEMISNIAHQWRQPLNTLALLAQEMHYYPSEKGTTKGAEANYEKTMEIINHMSKTIDDFRNFFRPEKEKTSFRVSERIEKALNLIEGSLKGTEIKIEMNCTADPEVVGFPNEFSQVLVNILTNARDAFQSVQVDTPTVSIDLFEEEGKTVVTITDNAGGMPVWVLEKIFEPYFTTKGPDKGTGVGLFMCKMIIEQSMNGRLSARNVDGGAQFRIEL